jgi:hypothetical protein
VALVPERPVSAWLLALAWVLRVSALSVVSALVETASTVK